MQLINRLELTPFLKIFTPFCLGIAIAPIVSAPMWIVILCASVIYIGAWILRGKPIASLYISMALFITAIAIRNYTEPKHYTPQSTKLHIIAEVQTIPHTKGRWHKSTAQIGYVRYQDSTQWFSSSELIELYTDTSLHVEAGDKLSFNGYLNAVDTTGGSYGRFMWSRGIVSSSYVMPYSIITHSSAEQEGFSHYIRQLQLSMAQRISRLSLNTQQQNMVMALVAGDKRGVDKTTKDNYSRSGVSHIMAVSGLHLGFILIIINLLLFWIALLPYGHIIKNCIVIIALWVYALSVGASPSVIRAAFMMSMVQMAYATSSDATGYNILFIAATIMLASNPLYLYDISYQLSFMAVLSIMFFAGRLYKRKPQRLRIIDLLISSIMVTIAAQIATLPLVVYNFNNLPLLSVFVNPVIMLTSFIIIFLGIIWVVFPLGFICGAISKILALTINTQNSIIDNVARLPVASIEDINISGTLLCLIYGLMLTTILIIKIREKNSIFAK